MENIYAFNKTVIGQSHIDRRVPCEDYSDSFSSESGDYHIIAIADGHGSKEFFRSSVGSEKAVEIALANLKELAESVVVSEESEERFYLDIFTNPRYRQTTMQFLTNAIIAQWHDAVTEHYEMNPPTTEEIAENVMHDSEIHIPRIYGTTLIAVLSLPKCFLAIHQGDGRCEMFYEDGSVDQPVPWDSRCEDNATTSLCDADSVTSIRSYVHDQRDKKIVACFIGSDGVEDAFRDTYVDDADEESLMGGVHAFYKDMVCHIIENDKETFEKYLSEMLPNFSAGGLFSGRGSQDDISVAGIVYKDAVKEFYYQYKKDVQIYSLEEKLFWKNNELLGKTRKHSILEKRLNEKKEVLRKRKAEIISLERELGVLNKKKEEIEKRIEEAVVERDQVNKPLVESDNKEGSSENSLVERFAKKIGMSSKQIEERMSKEKKRIESRLETNASELAEVKKAISSIDKEINDKKSQYIMAEGEEVDARNAFEDYDAIYRQIQSDCQNIEREISKVSQRNEM